MIISWVLRLGEHARVLEPARRRRGSSAGGASRERTPSPSSWRGPPRREPGADAPVTATAARAARDRDPPGALRAPRDARSDPDPLRPPQRAPAGPEVCERLQISDQELREDIDVLNVVNFGGGTYVLYAEVDEATQIDVDPEPYWTTSPAPRGCSRRGQGARRGDRPDRRPPARGRAHAGAREDRRGARRRPGSRACRSPRVAGDDSVIARVVTEAIQRRRLLSWSTTRRTRTSSPSASSSPTACQRARGLVRGPTTRPRRTSPLPAGPHQQAEIPTRL